MTDTMIERVARHLCAKAGTDPDERVYPPLRHGVIAELRTRADQVPAWTFYIGPAREVIEAMREPTPAVLLALRNTAPVDGYEAEYVETDAPDCWRALIDAALAETYSSSGKSSTE